MLRTGQLPSPRFDGRDLSRRREPCYRGPWRLPGPDFHRLADASLSLGCASLITSFFIECPSCLGTLGLFQAIIPRSGWVRMRVANLVIASPGRADQGLARVASLLRFA